MKLLLFTGLFFFNALFLFGQYERYQTFYPTVNGKSYEIKYLVHKRTPNTRQVLKRDFVTFHLETRTEKDSLLKTTYPKSPIIKELSIEDYRYMDKGFLEDMLLQLFVGDSATFLVNSNDVYEAVKRPRPKFIRPGEYVKYIFKILRIQSELEVQNDKKDKVFQLKKADDKVIAQYIAKNLREAKKTYSGIWYHIHQSGNGNIVLKDDLVSLKYEVRFMDGKLLNSSEKDGKFFEFPVGGGFAIKGLDEALQLMKVGDRGTFIIPSYLAYGEEGIPGVIPPASCLIYDLEVIEITLHKLIIENKGNVLEEEKRKEKPKDPKAEEERKMKMMEKDVQKKMKGVDIKGN